MPSDPPRLSQPGLPLKLGHAAGLKPAPPSGNKRRVDNSRDAEQELPRSPVEELNRQKMLAALEEARRQEFALQEIARQEEYARQELSRQQEIVRREEARKAARVKKFQHAWHILNNLERHDKQTVALELSRARMAARQEYLEQWTKDHLRELVAPIMRRLNQVATRLSAVDNGLTQLLGGMQEFRHNLLQRAQSTARQFEFIKNAGSVDPILRETGYKMNDVATIVLPMSTLRSIALDLKQRGLWNTDAAIPTDTTIPDFFRGSKTPRVRRAMIGILWVRHELIQNAAVIAQELHLLRKVRTTYLLNSGVPEVFDFNARHTRLYMLSVEIVNNSTRINTHYHHLRLMISQASPFSRRTNLVHHPRHQFLPLKAQVVSQDAHQLFKDTFSAPMATGMRTNLALQEAQLSNFRPVTIFISRMSTIAELAHELSSSGLLDQSSPASQALATLANELFAARRELYNLLDLAMLWRGTADMYLGILHRPREKSHLMLFADPPPDASALPRPSGKCPPAALGYSPPWQRNAQLYSKPESSIPVHFVTAPEAAYLVLQRFARCKVLGVDTITMAGAKGIPTGSSPVEYLIVSSDREVAIFALGLMNPAVVLHSRCFRQTLGNPAILKVGVNIGFQKNILAEHFGIELIETHGINKSYDRMHRRGDLNDPSFAILSFMAAQSFGSALPHLDVARAIRELGTKDPCIFFTHLASRAYAALQMYHLSCAEMLSSDPSAVTQTSPPSAEFGPVDFHMLGQEKSSRDRVLLARSPPLRHSGAAYVAQLAHAMARKAFETNPNFHELKRMPRRKRPALVEDVISSLQAYFLFTSFRQDLRTLNSFGIRHPASTILRIAEKAELPLHREDRITLDMLRRREPVGPLPTESALQSESEPQPEDQAVVLTDGKLVTATYPAPRSSTSRLRIRATEIGKVGSRAARKTPQATPRKSKELLSPADQPSVSPGATTSTPVSKEPATAAEHEHEHNPRFDKVETFYRSLNSTTPAPSDQGTLVIDGASSGIGDVVTQRESRDADIDVPKDPKQRSETLTGSGGSNTPTLNESRSARPARRSRGWWAG
ncbi:hypothetical protein A1O1_03774 [Capronia coronata CBS 617.96]|uniref:3'-5' exonuclease domain-containing protein n=1 Tax=Capronia coronata CBS 617.96 TaxID=1182541 RepID=W9YLV6_9EURO|nr:uncharacterized protein A1O1_03774 [Capronia coronata CBS 617.96]EXJ90670.1 hypothetical protein A1O1_03774 [Capronia coronata CBS 617.96]